MGRLEGIRILVTRPRSRAEELCSLLEAEGAQVMLVPLLEIAPPENDGSLLAAARDVGRYAWVIFASPSAVEALVEATRAAGTFAALANARIAVVGPKTAKAAREAGLPIARQATLSTGLGLYEDIRDLLAPSDEVLLPAAEEGRLELHDALAALGVRVSRIAAYRARKKELEPTALSALEVAQPHVVLFASPRTAEVFLETAGDVGRRVLSRAAVIALGPTTSSALAAMGVSVAAVAEQPTPAALVAAAVRAIRG